MGGVDVGGGGKGKRKSLDSEINMIPMIDLLMVTISFLLITAVWTHMARIDASAQVPTNDPSPPPCDGDCKDKSLHVDMRTSDRFVLSWRQDGIVVRSLDVPRRATKTPVGAGARTTTRFDELAAAVANEWGAQGEHKSPTDRVADRAVLHTANDTRYEEMIAVMDAIYQVRRPGPAKYVRPAFGVSLATN